MSQDHYKYGIVIDAGSSGSRLYVYRWLDPAYLTTTDLRVTDWVKHSVPQIEHSEDWVFKVKPGLSSFEHDPDDAFEDHIEPLLRSAEKVIPANKIPDTPVFLQATAGMRLLREKTRNEILEEVCKGIKKSTNFLMKDCKAQVQIIDGETEGLYGWLGLNYLSGNFNNYDADLQTNAHFSFGFMDMGGASAQIAFAPSDPKEVQRHKEDIATVYLKSVNGDVQEWNVFVSTWLGFGANQARSRYLAQLINALPENTNDYDEDDFATRTISDPCGNKGSVKNFKFKGKEFTIVGLGDFEQCSKSIYPLLLKNIPCLDEPCLFNGVHVPTIDFTRDKFVGVSEYWYTPHDLFQLGGPYDFEVFSKNVKDFCSTDWDTVMKNSKAGIYGSMPEEFLIDSCFKSNWILNVLHEGFNMPSSGGNTGKMGDIKHTDPVFQTMDKIKGMELSWTLGKILLYASATVPSNNGDVPVGIQPSLIEAKQNGKTFISGLIGSVLPEALKEPINSVSSQPLPSSGSSHYSRTWILFIFLMCLAFVFIGYVLRVRPNIPILRQGKVGYAVKTIRSNILGFVIKLKPGYNDSLSRLEEGRYELNEAEDEDKSKDKKPFVTKSKSMLNVGSKKDSLNGGSSGSASPIPRPLLNMMGKPFSARSIPRDSPRNPSTPLATQSMNSSGVGSNLSTSVGSQPDTDADAKGTTHLPSADFYLGEISRPQSRAGHDRLKKPEL